MNSNKIHMEDDNVILISENLDKYIKEIEENFNINILLRGNEIKLIGSNSDIQAVKHLLDYLIKTIKKEKKIDKIQVTYAIDMIKVGSLEKLENLSDELIYLTHKGKRLKPKTLGQQKYIEIIKNNDITFGIGPAGTGKTYLAIAMAVKAFKNKEVEKIVLTRPALEAGESLGFLPGDLQEKIDPYLRPLYDALFDILGVDSFYRYKEKGQIEVAPIAYMRGRTLDSSFIILDEGQNTTKQQMKMFLTRLGNGSKAIITGDLTQIDLPTGKLSGLREASSILRGIKGIGFNFFDKEDVVRNRLVMDIIQAYEKLEEKNKKEK